MPEGLNLQAWHLFVIFIATIACVIVNAMPIMVASIIGLAVAVLTHTMTPYQAYSGFSEDFILLIVVAFLVARGVTQSGIGSRIGYLIISKFGHSSLGLAYSVIAADILIGPAFPSNTARSGVLFPIVNSVANDSGSQVADGSRKKLGAYLMMCSMSGLTISSALWLTAMAANPAGVSMARDFGIDISYADWVIAASLPCLLAFLAIPWVLYKVFTPELTATPEAPQRAKEMLAQMGPVTSQEKIMAATFIGMVTLWMLSGELDIDKTAVAFLGLAVLMLANIFTVEDLQREGRALETLIWFAILFAMSRYLNEFGFMGWLGDHISHAVSGLNWPLVYTLLIVAYVLIHYFFVSQTAQMLALFSVFLGVAISAGVPGELMTLMLLFATNFNAVISPHGSSCNVIYLGSGYVEAGEIYHYGGIVTLVNLLIFMIPGTFWILLVL